MQHTILLHSDTVMQYMNTEDEKEVKKKSRKKCQSITNNLKQWTKSITKIKFIRLKCVGCEKENVRAHTKEKPSNKSPSKSAMNEIVVDPHTHLHETKSKIIKSKYDVNKKIGKKKTWYSLPAEESRGSGEEAKREKYY